MSRVCDETCHKRTRRHAVHPVFGEQSSEPGGSPKLMYAEVGGRHD